MKILKLELENLNSLRGRHVVDFEDGPLAAALLFAITGPTGAGKTTLLDALTLALYGRTKRLGKSPEEVMSHGSSDCLASVVYETKKGRFRSTWVLGRTRTGTLKPPKLEITELTSGELLADKLTQAVELTAELTGLNFDQFLRSVLLAQGDFAAFLESSGTYRAELLRQITGTDLYKLVIERANERYKAAKSACEHIEAQRKALTPLGREERFNLERDLQHLKQQIDELEGRREGLEQQIKCWDAAEQAARTWQAAQAESEAAEQAAHKLAPDRQRLDQHRRYLPLQPIYTQWKDLTDRLARTRKQLVIDQELAIDLAEQERQQQQQVEAARQAWANFEWERGEREQVLEELTRVDTQLDELRKACKGLQDKAKATRDELNKAQSRRDACSQAVEAEGTQQAERAAWLERHAHWRPLVSQVEFIKLKYKDLSFNFNKKENLNKDINKKEQQIKQLTQVCAALESRCAAAEAAAQDETHAALLANLRQTLHDGQPCPLCGSEHHPAAHNRTDPALSLEELAAATESRSRQLAELNDLKQQREQQQNELQSLRINCDRDRQTLQEIEAHVLALEQEELRPLLVGSGFELPPQPSDRWLADVTARLLDYDRRAKDAETSESRLRELQNDFRQAQETCDRLHAQHAEQLAELAARTEEGQNLKAKRLDLAGGSEKSVATLRQALKARESQLLKAKEDSSHQIAETQKKLAVLKLAIEKHTTDLLNDGQNADRLVEELNQQGIDQPDTLASLLLPAAEAQQLETRIEQADKLLTSARAVADERRKEHESQQQAVAELPPRATVEATLAEQKAKQDECRHRVGQIESQIENDDAQLEKSLRLEAELNVARAEFDRWDRLKALIDPSGKGQTKLPDLNKFAQSLTLDQLVRRANLHLQRIFPRYRIQRKKEDAQGLELQIEDLHLAGQLRATKTLSGGESFVVSLALALGLADLAGGRVRIDSLFIDEGFGSLDPQTLDKALTALDNLQATGKRIGIISHVEALKERIGSQVQVQRVREGVSRLLIV